MTDQQAIKFISDIFDLIEKSKTIEELEAIYSKLNIPLKNRMNVNGYPKIEFNIQPDEIRTLIDKNFIDIELNFNVDITKKLTDPLTKLLYATAWKNGDLKKIKHIIKGILDSENESDDQINALVFYQFGKYLTKNSGQPIIDQHVIRAFAVYNSTDNEKIIMFRKLEILDKKHKFLIQEYKNWLTSDRLNDQLKNQTDYTYHIDKLLFASGKTIKFHKSRKKKSTGTNRVDGSVQR